MEKGGRQHGDTEDFCGFCGLACNENPVILSAATNPLGLGTQPVDR